ncbi:hypothetical protein N5U06_10485 [Aliarcobacter butzleri]|uniref:acylneuraminate cytidylyltransferase family protein n=1 Tax=Aliarcobacter butzleri TaxID=28197 RepID=UPI0021B2B8A0|nr:hypothetical protein [Aliarcobacter butzleri]MCT7631151.1 hypothetical protein [Aliarcobacter butzleri]
MNTTVYVPARLNSERLPRKVLKDFHGQTLISIILDKLSKSSSKDYYFLNTDDDELIDYAKNLGHKVYIRSPGLTKSNTTTEEILLDFVNKSNCKTEYVAAINPTNPLLTVETIDKFINEVYEKNYDTAFSTSTIKKHCLIDAVPVNYSPFGPHPRTQDVKEIQVLNWAIVMWRTSYVKERIIRKGDSIYLGKVGFINIPENESTDIDTAVDFEFALQLSKFQSNDK